MAHIPFMKKALSVDELAVIYAALILTDDDIPVTEDKIQTIVAAADLKVEPVWPSLYAKALKSVNVKELVCKVGGGAVRGAAQSAGLASAPVAGQEEEKKEDKKVEEEEDESDEDMGLSLFD